MTLDELENSLHCSSSAPYRTQSRILGLHFSTGIAFQSILLVLEKKTRQNRPVPIVEDDGAVSLYNFECRIKFLLAECSPYCPQLVHEKTHTIALQKKGNNQDICGMIFRIVEEYMRSIIGHTPQEFKCYRLLILSGR